MGEAESALPADDALLAKAVRGDVGALSALLKRYGPQVRLYDPGGLSGPEVGAVMGRSRDAMFMLLAGAHDTLRENLGFASRLFGLALMTARLECRNGA